MLVPGDELVPLLHRVRLNGSEWRRGSLLREVIDRWSAKRVFRTRYKRVVSCKPYFHGTDLLAVSEHAPRRTVGRAVFARPTSAIDR